MGEHCFGCGKAIEEAVRFCGFCGTRTLAVGFYQVINYDGVYVTKPQVENDLIVRRYFRFYPDRVVVGITFASRNNTGVATWWGRRSGGRLNGYYRVDGRDIEMACMGDTKALVYRGRFWRNGLKVSSCNGKECKTFYRFVEGREGEHTQDSLRLPAAGEEQSTS